MLALNIYEVLGLVPESEANYTSLPPAPSSPKLSSSELDWTDERTEEDVYLIPFNPVQLRTKFNGRPIFTCHLLREIKHNKTTISIEMQKPLHIRKSVIAEHQSRFGKFKIWNPDVDDADDNNDFQDHVMEQELAEDCFSAGDDGRDYWLSSIQLYSRR